MSLMGDRQEAVDTLVNGPFGGLIHPHIFRLKMLIRLGTAHIASPRTSQQASRYIPEVSISLSSVLYDSSCPGTERVIPQTLPQNMLRGSISRKVGSGSAGDVDVSPRCAIGVRSKSSCPVPFERNSFLAYEPNPIFVAVIPDFSL